jgi:hypothetical protein
MTNLALYRRYFNLYFLTLSLFGKEMFRRCLRRLVVRTLPDNTKLDGVFHPTHANRLLSGVAMLPDGRCFKGTFDESTGAPLKGTQLEEDGDLYVGSYNAKWQRDGQGEAWLADGTHYKGIFSEDELISGAVRIPSGVTEVLFEGTLQDEEFVKGTLKQSDFTYTGEFLKNRPHGKGVLEFANGATQEGTFRDGSLHGPNCTMKLEGGFVYVGSFMDGKIQRGLLYTPTYTYDGEFSEQGKAHGEGTQVHLAMSPKLTFTGIWHHGNLIRGTCVDEHGAPVDWQDRHDIQEQVIEEKGGNVQMQTLMRTRLKEADSLYRDFEKSYADDADVLQKEKGGLRPSKFDLGYEHSLRTESTAVQQELTRQSRREDAARSDSAFLNPSLEDTRPEFAEDVKNHAIDVNLANVKLREQAGCQRVMADRVNEQVTRFMAEQSNPNPEPKRGLTIDGNPTWKGFTAK